MKKVISIILVVVMLCSTFVGLQVTSSAALPSSGSCGANVTYTFDSATGELTISGTGPMNEYEYDYVHDDYNQRNYFWCNSPFYNQTGIKTVVIESGVTSIGNSVFINCSNLTSITIPDSVTSIGNSAFINCSNLTSITIPNSVTSIDGDAFYGCSGLTSITIPDSVTYIGYGAFSGCSGLTSVTIGNSVTSIGWQAFYNCSGLTSVTIGNSVTSIGDEAFSGCSGLTRVGITDINAWLGIAFADEDSNPNTIAHHLYLNGEPIKQVVVPAGQKTISQYAFDYCESLENVVFPDSVTSIGTNAFRHCKNLKSVVLPASVKEVGQEAFWYCPRLETITVQNMDCAFGPQAVSFGTKMIAPLDSTAYEFARNYNMEFIELGSEIPGEHRWDAGVVTKPATCHAEGVITYTCLDCAQTKQEVISKTAHQYEHRAVKATCISQGFTVYTCANCGDTYRVDYVPATDTHDYKAVTTTPATCSQAGVKTFTCTVCGDKYTETIPMKAHTVVSDSAVAPTCTKYGLSAGKYCSVCGKVFELQEKLEPLGHDFATVVTPETLTANGIIKHPCSRCDKSAASEVIYAPKTFTLAKTSYVYSGKAIAPAVTVKDAKGNVLKKGTDYTVAYKANKAIGTASAVITFKGNYKGTKTLAFTIVPKATNLALAGAKKAFTAKWTKVAGVTGYQIQYATNAKFTGAKAVNVKGASKAAQAVKNLKGGAKYYVRIRTYKTVGGKNYFSAWSAAKAVTTKK